LFALKFECAKISTFTVYIYIYILVVDLINHNQSLDALRQDISARMDDMKQDVQAAVGMYE